MSILEVIYNVLLVTCLICLPPLAPQTPANEDKKPAVDKPTIEFLDKKGGPNDCDCVLIIELEGVKEKEKMEMNWKGKTPVGPTAEGFTSAIEVYLKGAIDKQPEWQYSRKANAEGREVILEIEGWTDPKTKKLHRIKEITFESNMPKDYWPKITMPKKSTKD
jgi:hypothetical protein